MDHQAPLLQVSKLTKSFGDLLVLDEVSFDVAKHEFLCVVGPTGCGKTTFLNCLTKLYEPTSGEILLNGKAVDLRKDNVSYIFQESSSMEWLTVEQNVGFGLDIKGIKGAEKKNAVNEALEMVGLQDFRNYYPREISASMLQRVVIARAFATKPDLLLMDEPYGQLDIELRYKLEDELITTDPQQVKAIVERKKAEKAREEAARRKVASFSAQKSAERATFDHEAQPAEAPAVEANNRVNEPIVTPQEQDDNAMDARMLSQAMDQLSDTVIVRNPDGSIDKFDDGPAFVKMDQDKFDTEVEAFDNLPSSETGKRPVATTEEKPEVRGEKKDKFFNGIPSTGTEEEVKNKEEEVPFRHGNHPPAQF